MTPELSTIIVAIIALLGTLGGSYFGVRAANKLVEFRLRALEEKVDKHNQIIERTYKLEEKSATVMKDLNGLGDKVRGIGNSVSELERVCDVVQEQIKVVNHRVADLETEKEK